MMLGLGTCACDAANDYAVCDDGSTCLPNGNEGSASCGLLQLLGPVGPLANLVGYCPGFAPNPSGTPAAIGSAALKVVTPPFCGTGSYQFISGVDNCTLLIGAAIALGLYVFVIAKG